MSIPPRKVQSPESINPNACLADSCRYASTISIPLIRSCTLGRSHYQAIWYIQIVIRRVYGLLCRAVAVERTGRNSDPLVFSEWLLIAHSSSEPRPTTTPEPLGNFPIIFLFTTCTLCAVFLLYRRASELRTVVAHQCVIIFVDHWTRLLTRFTAD